MLRRDVVSSYYNMTDYSTVLRYTVSVGLFGCISFFYRYGINAYITVAYTFAKCEKCIWSFMWDTGHCNATVTSPG